MSSIKFWFMHTLNSLYKATRAFIYLLFILYEHKYNAEKCISIINSISIKVNFLY